MKKVSPISIILIVLLIAVTIFLLVPKDHTVIPEGEGVELIMFYSVGCQHCVRMELFLDDIQKEVDYLKVYKYEVNEDDNIKLYYQYAKKYGVNVDGVPVVYIKDRVFEGHNSEIEKDLEIYIKQCVEEFCTIPENNVEEVTQTIAETDSLGSNENMEKATISAVIFAAALDSINPCVFAVLIILLTTILATGIKKKALFAGLAFTLSTFISYFLMGIGLFSALKSSGLTRIFYFIVSILAILIGLFNLKDYFWYGKWFIMEVPLKWRPLMKDIIKEITTVKGAFLVGFLVSLFLLPCTSGPYLAILGLLAEVTSRNYAYMLLILYNFIFVLPMLLITLAIYFGFTTTEKAEEWRTKKLKVLHLIGGIILLLLGVGMLIAMWLGYI